MFLLYLLARRLQERQPVALQMDSQTFALFDEHGVSLHKSSLDSAFLIPKCAWALSDSGAMGDVSPCPAFIQQRPHMVHTSSPASHCWETWVKALSARKYIMDVWSPDEFQTLLYVVSSTPLSHSRIGPSTIRNLDVQRGVALFQRYGPNPRIIIDILLFPESEAIYLRMSKVLPTRLLRTSRQYSFTLKNSTLIPKVPPRSSLSGRKVLTREDPFYPSPRHF